MSAYIYIYYVLLENIENIDEFIKNDRKSTFVNVLI